MRFWVTPVPIPNTTVKTKAADGTALETMWKSRWLPDSFLKRCERKVSLASKEPRQEKTLRELRAANDISLREKSIAVKNHK